MEGSSSSRQEDLGGDVPVLLQYISSKAVSGFDSIQMSNLIRPSDSQAIGNETPAVDHIIDESNSQTTNHQRKQSVSISMPASPVGESSKEEKRVMFKDNGDVQLGGIPDSSAAYQAPPSQPSKVRFLSQPLPKGMSVEGVTFPNLAGHPSATRKLRDKRYDSFKTWSGKLERQISQLRGRPLESSPEDDSAGQKTEKLPPAAAASVPVDRYFDALEGPELETLRSSEEILLPEDKTWPFLLRYPISSFGMCLGVSSQAILWKTLATSSSTKFLHITLGVNLVLWWISVVLYVIIAAIYIPKLIFYFEAVRREYYHPIRVNFFFAPWIALLFLAIGVPPTITENLHKALWYVLMTPILCLELKIYGQWMSGGQRRLSKVANPTNHLSIVGNFVGALLGASMGLKEGPIFFFAVGMAHYTVLFVTLYQRLPTNETLPKELHPVFFLFIAAPSVASMAWAKITGSFDYGARIAYFIALFLYFSLAVRVNFFRGFKFSLSWWAYTFPMTGAAIATIRYSSEVTNIVTKALAVVLCAVSTLTVTGLLVTTILHAFVFRNLFPNDIAIAISDRKPKHHHNRKWFPIRHGSSENKEIENYLKHATSDSQDLEASLDSSDVSNKV